MSSNILPYSYWYLATLTVILIQIFPPATSSDYQREKLALFPGPRSCQTIYDNYPENRDTSAYYVVTEYCGMSYNGLSCEDIHAKNPEIRNQPGFYRVKNQWVFCNMTAISEAKYVYVDSCAGVGGGWKKIGHFDISAGDDCPSGWTKDTVSGVSFCRPPGKNPPGYKCYSVHFPTNGRSYKSVCGRARGYQKGDVWGFWGSTTTQGNSIEGSYVDGLSITHRSGHGPRHHIFTYAVGHYDHSSVQWGCPCSPYQATPPPSYINGHYYCESGASHPPSSGSKYFFSDPLWDGSGCSYKNKCCSRNENQPYFFRKLSSSTTDDIEARLCITWATYASGAVVLDQLELYIQ